MKIALVGTCSSGKTTTLTYCKELLSTQYPDIGFVEEVARQFFTTHPEARDWKQLKTQRAIAHALIESEKEALEKHSIILGDSSVFEACAYTRALDDTEAYATIVHDLRDWFPTYDLLLVCDPSTIPLEQDGLRTETEDIRLQVHENLITLLTEEHIPYTLLTGPKEERCDLVSTLLTKNLTNT